MFFEKLRHLVRVWLCHLKYGSRLLSEGEILQADMEQRYREEPGYDHPARVITCAGALRRGTPRDFLVVVYGEQIVSEAERFILPPIV